MSEKDFKLKPKAEKAKEVVEEKEILSEYEVKHLEVAKNRAAVLKISALEVLKQMLAFFERMDKNRDDKFTEDGEFIARPYDINIPKYKTLIEKIENQK